MRVRVQLCALAFLSLVALAACSKPPTTGSTPPPTVTPQVTPIIATTVDPTFVTMDHMMAAVEMQLSGEPLAESMGRLLTGYSRDALPPDQYFSPLPDGQALPQLDLVGYSSAVESYEYSKQPMNNLAFESGAGLSLLAGPVLNPSGLTGTAALDLLQARMSTFGQEALTTMIITFDTDLGSTMDPLGWPGIWPTMHPYRSFDPSITPTDAIDWLCSISSDDDPHQQGGLLNVDYECDARTLNLPHRNQQVELVLTPGSSGWADWKYALWTINYLSVMHDAIQSPVTGVAPSDLPLVGTPGNLVQGQGSTVRGVFLGSSYIEGFQAAMMITELDNQFQQWLSSLTTTDGTTLSGFGTLLEALQYDYSAPLRWIPEQIAVTEAPDPDPNQPFPLPSGYSIQSSQSSLLDLAGLLGAASEMYALTDLSNGAVGGLQSTQVYFDGDPFPVQNQLPTGEFSLHDRSLALIRFLVVTLDRLHRDPTSGLLVDTVTFNQGAPSPGTTVAADSVAYSLVALRTARKSLASDLSLYANTTPDAAAVSSVMDSLAFTGAPDGATFTARLNALINAQSAILMNGLTTPDGHAFSGWNVATSSPTDMTDTLDAHSAAIRGLLAGYLCTGDTRYRDRAVAVFHRMDSVFFHPTGRVYMPTPYATAANDFSYTPRRFGLLQGALRDLYELVGATPGQTAFGVLLQTRIARLNKLILNGWDDRNLDGSVNWPGECISYYDGIPHGGLQMAERALSGETGSVNDLISGAGSRVATFDRESDCVPDIAAAHLPSALANELGLRLMQ